MKISSRVLKPRIAPTRFPSRASRRASSNSGGMPTPPPIKSGAVPDFSAAALRAAAAILCGQVRTYGELAAEMGLTNGARAVGQAMASNPIPIILPCHRVLGADRRLHGYSGLNGIETKAWLLKLEGSTFQSQLF